MACSEETKEEVVRNLSAQEIFNLLTEVQKAALAVLLTGLFDITFDPTFE